MRANRTSEPTVSVIVPTRNEAANLELVLPRIPDVHEVIMVDGHSTDGSAETALAVRPSVRVLQQSRTGKGNAMACGFAAATGQVLVMFDADGSADPEEIPLFVETLTRGYDYAKGTRYSGGGGSEDLTFLRSLGNLFLNSVSNLLFATRHTDLCYGYNAFWRDLLPLLDLPAVEAVDHSWGDGFEIEAVIACRMAMNGVLTAEVPSVELNRIHGESKLNPVTDGLRILRTITAERLRTQRQLPEVAAA